MRTLDRRAVRNAFIGYAAISLGVMAVIFATVHRAPLDPARPPRWLDTIERWQREGYFKQGGMQFDTYEQLAGFGYRPPPASAIKPTTVFAWKNTTMAWLQGANIVERLYHSITGRFSARLMVLHHQTIIAASSTLLALLAMLLAEALGLERRAAFLLGLSCLVAHQTFQLNLYEYLDFYPAPVVVLLALAFLVVDAAEKLSLWRQPSLGVSQFVLGFLMVYVEPVTSGLFLAGYLAVRWLLDPQRFRWRDCVLMLLAPAVMAFVILRLQRALVSANYPDVIFVGSDLGFRTGLDGDVAYYFNQWDLLTRRFINTSVHTDLAALCRWGTLFVGGAISIAVLLAVYVRESVSRYPVQVVLNLVGLSIPFVYIFSQAAVIHPYEYDLFAVLPCILSLFCVLPAYIESRRPTGVLVLISVVSSCCFAMVHLRTYAAVFQW